MSNVPKLLVVDDDQMMLDFAVQALARIGFAAVASTNAEAALLVLKQDSEIRVGIFDINLGRGLTGVELANEAHALRPDIGIVLTSGDHNALHRVMEGIRYDIDILPKPYRLSTLREKLSQFT
jgi:DNA-binding NtrC family response regulator